MRTMKYDTYLFDLDGTLLDTTAGILNALNRICEEFNIPKIKESQVKKYIGPVLNQVLLNMYPEATKEQLEIGVKIYKDYFSQQGVYEAEIYEGIPQLLQYLKKTGARLGIVSLKYQEAVDLTVGHYKLERYFDQAFGCDLEGKLSKYDLIEKCRKELGNVDRGKTLMVGDSPYDAEGARQSGIDFAAVTFGFGFTPENVKKYDPILTISSPYELLEAIRRL